MVIKYNLNNQNYSSSSSSNPLNYNTIHKKIIRNRDAKVLTSQNKQYLISLGFNVKV